MPPAARTLGIGAVVSALAAEFPDVTVSKVRFLESEGLVEPERTGSGYRRFTTGDVERLRYVLRAQRDLFWPLRVIKEALAAADRGLEPGAPDAAPGVPEPAPEADLPDASGIVAPGGPRLTPEELAAAGGLDAATVEELTTTGLLRPGNDGLHPPADLRAARAAAGLARYGLQTRHLRAFRAAADREVGLVEQATGALRGEAAQRARAEVADLALALHAALVRGGLGRSD